MVTVKTVQSTQVDVFVFNANPSGSTCTDKSAFVLAAGLGEGLLDPGAAIVLGIRKQIPEEFRLPTKTAIERGRAAGPVIRNQRVARLITVESMRATRTGRQIVDGLICLALG